MHQKRKTYMFLMYPGFFYICHFLLCLYIQLFVVAMPNKRIIIKTVHHPFSITCRKSIFRISRPFYTTNRLYAYKPVVTFRVIT